MAQVMGPSQHCQRGLKLAMDCPAGCQLYPGCCFPACTAAKEIQRLSIPTCWPLAFIETGLLELLWGPPREHWAPLSSPYLIHICPCTHSLCNFYSAAELFCFPHIYVMCSFASAIISQFYCDLKKECAWGRMAHQEFREENTAKLD